MSSRRILKAASAIRQVVSSAILTELRDPRVKNVTVTFVEVSPDMQSAKVLVSVMGNETQQQLALRGLQNAAGFLQHKIATGIDTRYTPRLRFELDQGVKKSIEVARILNELRAESSPTSESETAEHEAIEFDDDVEDFADEADGDDADGEEIDESEDGSDDSEPEPKSQEVSA